MANGDRPPLHGVTVVSLEHAVAAPHASRQLADLGARVIKIERVEGGDFGRNYDKAINGTLSSVFLWTSRGKESVAVDLGSEHGSRLLDTLLTTADVLLQNLAPGALDRLGFPIDGLGERFPRLIVVSNSGYGTAGPFSNKRAYDALIQAESGITAATGTPDAMSKPGFSAADVAAGMFMFSAALAGLYQRERTGEGSIFDISMLDSMVDAFSNHVYKSQYTGHPTDRHGMGHPFAVPYGAFQTTDGPIMLGIQNDREWSRFASSVLGRPELVDDPAFATNIARTTNRVAVETLVSKTFEALSSAEVGAALDRAHIAWSNVHDSLTVAAHPQFVERDRWVTIDSPAGPVETLANVITERGKKYRYGAVPTLGEHTESVLSEAGFTAEEIASMRKDGTIS
ncbi:CaiB/BaiF CoA transferase family protein [Rhodococcus cercidiphylli]|uniref:CaiB/BaiF CoA-transferase family protein n=1 Tax=Rhodococcus cercidiphylli TaxID=489916 RepID=A0ABU4AWJ8_9NOCA|nr:CaiB/BaiF CoA-transferase family protein [Rhodococcus cercidiphylli]MDV6230602.1 CaiB/BaiF CoA-transferase family protein [Rhodococcus cercidiphylli]